MAMTSDSSGKFGGKQPAVSVEMSPGAPADFRNLLRRAYRRVRTRLPESAVAGSSTLAQVLNAYGVRHMQNNAIARVKVSQAAPAEDPAASVDLVNKANPFEALANLIQWRGGVVKRPSAPGVPDRPDYVTQGYNLGSTFLNAEAKRVGEDFGSFIGNIPKAAMSFASLLGYEGEPNYIPNEKGPHHNSPTPQAEPAHRQLPQPSDAAHLPRRNVPTPVRAAQSPSLGSPSSVSFHDEPGYNKLPQEQLRSHVDNFKALVGDSISREQSRIHRDNFDQLVGARQASFQPSERTGSGFGPETRHLSSPARPASEDQPVISWPSFETENPLAAIHSENPNAANTYLFRDSDNSQWENQNAQAWQIGLKTGKYGGVFGDQDWLFDFMRSGIGRTRGGGVPMRGGVVDIDALMDRYDKSLLSGPIKKTTTIGAGLTTH